MIRTSKIFLPLIAALTIICLTQLTWAQRAPSNSFMIFEMDDFMGNELRQQTFKLKQDSELNIDLIGARNRDSDQYYAMGWILDSKTREIVWSLDLESTRRVEGDRRLRQFTGSIYLDEGEYEAYYYAGHPYMILGTYNFEKDIEGVGDVLNYLEGALEKEITKDGELADQRKRFKFAMSCDNQNFVFKGSVPPKLEHEVVSITRPRNLSNIRRGFSLSDDLAIRLYAIGEYSDRSDVFVDGAKIINARTREKVWAMERWNTDWSGGALKNRCFHDDIMLDEGEYILNYWTDDSHTFDDWNGTPPYDPYFWGVTLAAEDEEDLDKIKPSDVDERKTVLVQIVKVQDNENAARGFKLFDEIKVNIYAIGEGKKGVMYDYGWIETADDNEVVWSMKEEKTEHAGGAYKNRLFDGIIELDPGSYLLRYKSDGSHSYGAFNESPPPDDRHYGITLYVYDENFDPQDIQVDSMVKRTLEISVPGRERMEIIVAPHAAPDPEELQEQIEEYMEEYQALMQEIRELEVELAQNRHDRDAMKDIRKELQGLHKELQKLPRENQFFESDKFRKALEAQMKVLENQFYVADQGTSSAPPPPPPEGFLVHITGVGNNINMQQSFMLNEPSRVHIYALGEGVKGEMYDYGWIERKSDGSIIWEMTYRKTGHAGGASKNRVVDDIIMLDKGEYVVHYISDDSHSYDSWNAYQPDHPEAWGISVKKED